MTFGSVDLNVQVNVGGDSLWPSRSTFIIAVLAFTGSSCTTHDSMFFCFCSVFTLRVVLNHFGNENQRILKELSPHPKLLFNYVKAVMNIRSSGLENSQQEQEGDAPSTQQATASGESSGWSNKVAFSGHGREKDKSHSVLDSQVHLVDLLQRSGLEFTVEMAETFVEVG